MTPKIFFTALIWSGKAAFAVLLFLIVHHLGWSSLWWAVPLTMLVILGAYAELGWDHIKELEGINRDIEKVIEHVRSRDE